MLIYDIQPTTAVGSAPITWSVVDPDGEIEVWARLVPVGPWVLLGSFLAADGSTGATTFDFGEPGQRAELWVGGVAGFNQAGGVSPVIDAEQSRAQPIVWGETGIPDSQPVEVWVQPRDAEGNKLDWQHIGDYPAGAKCSFPDLYDFGPAGQQTEVWIGAYGGQVVGDTIYTVPA